VCQRETERRQKKMRKTRIRKRFAAPWHDEQACTGTACRAPTVARPRPQGSSSATPGRAAEYNGAPVGRESLISVLVSPSHGTMHVERCCRRDTWIGAQTIPFYLSGLCWS